MVVVGVEEDSERPKKNLTSLAESKFGKFFSQDDHVFAVVFLSQRQQVKRLKFCLLVGVLFGLNSVFNGQNRHIIWSFTAEGGVWRHRILVSNAKKRLPKQRL